MKVTINKTAKSFKEALGFDGDELAKKGVELCNKILKESIEAEEGREAKYTRLDTAQEIQDNFSDSEILALAVESLEAKVKEASRESMEKLLLEELIKKKISEAEEKEEIGE